MQQVRGLATYLGQHWVLRSTQCFGTGHHPQGWPGKGELWVGPLFVVLYKVWGNLED